MESGELISFFVHSPNPDSGTPHPASGWVAAWSGLLIAFMLGTVGAFILVLRHRAKHSQEDPQVEEPSPKPVPDSQEEGQEDPEAEKGQPWERPADWWKEE